MLSARTPGPCCVEVECRRPRAARGLCRQCYDLHRHRGDLAAAGLPPTARDDQGYAALCDRCRVQLSALAADGGRGDRALVAGTMTMAETSAYMLGFFDRRSAAGGAIDPYIVARFDELRGDAA